MVTKTKTTKAKSSSQAAKKWRSSNLESGAAILDSVCDCIRQFQDGIGAGLLHVVTTDRNAVEPACRMRMLKDSGLFKRRCHKSELNQLIIKHQIKSNFGIFFEV